MKKVWKQAPQLLLLTAAMLMPRAAGASDPAGQEPTLIHATGWGLTLAADGSGFYSDFAMFALDSPKVAAHYRVSPYKRAMRAFVDDKTSCVYPKSIAVITRTHMISAADALIESDAMLRSPVRIFSASGTPLITGNEDLAGLRLAYALGSKLPESIRRDDVRYMPVADEVDKAKLLFTGTVDAVAANMPDAYFVFRSLGRDLPPYDPAYSPFPEPTIRIVCHDTERNRAFVSALNARLKTLVSSGEAATFLSQAGLTPALYLPAPR